MQITCNTSSAHHVQHVVLRATWHEGTARLLSLTELKSHLFELYSIGRKMNRWRRGGNRSTRRKPLATSFRKCHILKPEDSSPKRDSNPHNSIGGRLGKQTRYCLLAGCLMSQQYANVSQGRVCSDNFTCCHTEIQVADQTFYLTQSQYTDTGPTSPSTDPITPGAWQGSHLSEKF